MQLLRNLTAALAFPLFLTCTSSAVTSQNAAPSMFDNPDVRAVVNQFAQAVESQDVAALEQLLHDEFRVIATRYPNAETTSILPRAAYIGAVGAKKLGGSPYQVEFKHISVTQQNATVDAVFKGEKSDMLLTLLLTQDAAGTWKIISDFPIIQPKG